jgi:squalene monooxygenase
MTDGCDSKFRKLNVDRAPTSRSRFYGYELIDAKLPVPKHGHVLLGGFSPILLYQIGTHETRILVDVPNDCPTASVAAGGIKAHMTNVVLPVLPEGVRSSFEKAVEGSKIRSMRNQWLPPQTNRLPGLIVLGDAMNMRHPLTGGGMTVAFNDVVLLSELLSPQHVPRLDDTKAVLKTFHWKRKDVSSVINILAQALYSLFAASGMYHFFPVTYGSVNFGANFLSRSKPSRSPKGLLSLFPTRWQLCRWPLWSARWDNTKPARPHLAFLRCCSLRHLD